MKKLKREPTSTVSGSDVLTNHLKEFLANLQVGANSEGQVELGATNEAEMKSLEVDDPSEHEIQSPRADDSAGSKMHIPGEEDPVVDNPEINKLDADIIDAEN